MLAAVAILASACSGGVSEQNVDNPPDDVTVDTSGNDQPAALAVDPAIRIGTLDNGLTYYLRQNDSPGGSVDLRLVVNAGSAQQVDPEDGIAHFLEHMLFNGTEKYPGNELDRALQDLGMEFGADTNARTTYDETVYSLQANATDPTAVRVAVDVMAQWAQAATLAEVDVEAERGVVRDERRQGRESVDGLIFSEVESIYGRGTEYENRQVIGTGEKIDSTEAPALRAFYDRWYRPDNMAIVMVGDLSLDDMEDLVIESFEAFEPRGNDHPDRRDIVVEPSPEPTVSHFTHPDNVVDNVSMDWRRPSRDLGTVAGAEAFTRDLMVSTMLTRRLQTAYFGGDLLLDHEPGFSPFAFNRGMDFFGTNLRSSDLAESVGEYLGVLKGVADRGFTPAEFDEALATERASLDTWESSIDSTQDAEYAESYVSFFLTGDGGEAPATAIQRERTYLDRVSVEDLNVHWAQQFASNGPIIVAIGADDAALPSVEELTAAATSPEPIIPADGGPPVDKLMTAPSPTEPSATREVDSPNGTITSWRFDNGTTVVFQESQIQEGTVLVQAESLGGTSLLPPDQVALAAVAVDAVSQSGLGDLSAAQLSQLLADQTVELHPWIDTETEGFSGSADATDVETMFQLLYLLVTKPRVDGPALSSALAQANVLLQASQSDSDLQANLALFELLYDADSTNWVASVDQLATATSESLLDLYLSRLGKVDDLVVSVAGDIDIDLIAQLAATYIGTLPAGRADTFVDTLPAPPTSVRTRPISLSEGTANGGLVMQWAAERSWSSADAATARVLEAIISGRIRDSIREELGAAYGGFASISPDLIPDQRMQLLVAIDGDPTRIDEIRTRTLGEIADLAANGPTAEEFDRIVAVLVDEFRFLNNGDFLNGNLAAVRDPNAPGLTLDNRNPLLAQVTRANVRALAGGLFDPSAYLEVVRS